MTLDHATYCDQILRQSEELRSHLAGADLTAAVPTCPDWTLRQLAVHVGGAQRWATEIVRTEAVAPFSPDKVPGAGGPEGDDPAALDAWLAEGAENCAALLREVGPDRPVWSWTGPATSAFWARRMTHETLVHRADAAGAVGAAYTVPAEVGADTLDEWLDVLTFPRVFRSDDTKLGAPGHSLHLHAKDTGAQWFIELDDTAFTWRRAEAGTHEKATVALHGPLADVLRVFYRRLPLDTPTVEILGDGAVLDTWLTATSF
ncbi:maleylpyruvate isomerase family mycothiol-dependent enzyme [Streptomyces sp. NBC_00083]|uniref:maleylpyruvate isomerase family mycothiol-dependent enzyme n=1 Tax=Streptomyces sp. NBC_00083 TaxID=2975647 RepID=UPI00225BCE15|nr:maleylpyruvate isomerase family mycothiol-dependent enzyme [Streptomyces sp. NBC_00083]MCX5382343.1 maleylpyruvate isomerase family mycothiol-dependent enzyme [Streptomyces sp. NBC_00083]